MYIHTHIHTYTHTRMYICMYICTHTYLPIYLPTYMHTYMNTGILRSHGAMKHLRQQPLVCEQLLVRDRRASELESKLRLSLESKAAVLRRLV